MPFKNIAKKPPEFNTVAVRLSALGDVVLTTGVLDYWRRTHGMTFLFITRKAHAALFLKHPAVSAVVSLTPGQMDNWAKTAADLTKDYGGLPLIDLHRNSRSLVLSSFWSGPVHRYPKYSLARRLYRLFGLKSARAKLEAYNVPQRYCMAIDKEPPPPDELTPFITVLEEEREQAKKFLADQKLIRPPRPLVALHPYATHENKAWPAEHWLELAKLLEQRGLGWFAIGRNPSPVFSDHNKSAELTNMTSLRATIALIEQADALVTGDSGPMHLGTAVGTPVVALFGPTTKAWGFFPSGPRDTVIERDLPCRPCSLHGGKSCNKNRQCLADITPAEVADAAERAVNTSEE